MSKIYNKYLELKEENNNQLYLFHNGKFYIFIAEDAETINQYVVLKKTRFTNEVEKCGFPEDRLEDYLRVFNNHHLNITLIESNSLIEEKTPRDAGKKARKYQQIKSRLQKVKIESTTPLEALEILDEIMRYINE